MNETLTKAEGRDYNSEHPHSSLQYQTPAAFIVAQTQTINSVTYAGANSGANQYIFRPCRGFDSSLYFASTAHAVGYGYTPTTVAESPVPN
jgi:hypothetical protein